MGIAGVGVVFGGPSPEHEVSLASARGVLENARSLGWDLLPVGVGRDGSWHLGPGALHLLWEQADHGRIPGHDTFHAEAGPVTSYSDLPPADAFAGHPAVFCYDLMNEPIIGGPAKEGEPRWVGGELDGFYGGD